MTYSDAIQFLYDLRWFGAKFGLSNTRKLAALAGNPQDRLRFIHVAGTNGKGSACAMLESIYRAAGLRVGLFTSPHLIAFGERIQVNRHQIPEADVSRLVIELRTLLHQGWGTPDGALADDPARTHEEHPTFFEVVTVMALRFFEEQRCDLVIWETGLGGRLDATNIVTPLASLITNIQFDHQKWLGHDLATIAGEKAGIIKPGVPVISGAEVPEAAAVINEQARQCQAPLTLVSASQAEPPPLDAIQLPLLGRHQRTNAALALAVVRVLQPVIPVSESQIRTGLCRVEWAGRLQLATRTNGSRVLLDGAHNLAGVATLAAEIRTRFPETKPTFVLGILEDKDWTPMCEMLAPLAGRLLLVPVHSQRTTDPSNLAAPCRKANPAARVEICKSLAEALRHCADDSFVVIAGSLYLVGEAMEILQLRPGQPANERGLNEWVPK